MHGIYKETFDFNEREKRNICNICTNASDEHAIAIHNEEILAKHIVTEVSIIRFNRIGSEGLSSHTVEGESLNFSGDDFMPYESDIQAWIDENKGTSRRGRIRFI